MVKPWVSPLQVRGEEQVLDAVQQYVGRRSGEAKRVAMVQLLPAVRLPLLQKATVLQRLEKDPWLMSLPTCKDLLFATFRRWRALHPKNGSPVP